MNNATRCAVTLLSAVSISSCSVPPVMIQASATCDELEALYKEQRELWIVAAASPLGAPYRSSVRKELDRIEAAMTARGCLMPDGASSESTPATFPTDSLEAAYTSLYAVAPAEFERYATSGEALQAVAPNEFQSYSTAGLALFIAAPAEFVIYNNAAKNLQNAAPSAFSSISTEHKVLYATIPPQEYVTSTDTGKALQHAAPEEFAAYDLAWKALRDVARDEFLQMADAQRVLYTNATIQFTELDAAGTALIAETPGEYAAFEYASLKSGTVEALRASAPREFTAYMGTPAGSEAHAAAFDLLSSAAPKEMAALGVLADILEGPN